VAGVLAMSSVVPGRPSARVRNRPLLAGLVRMGPGWRGPARPALLSPLLSDAHAFQVREGRVRGNVRRSCRRTCGRPSVDERWQMVATEPELRPRRLVGWRGVHLVYRGRVESGVTCQTCPSGSAKVAA
jgi:hypothetical protein